MTLERLVILNPSTVTLSEAKSLRTSSVKDLWQNDPLPGRAMGAGEEECERCQSES